MFRQIIFGFAIVVISSVTGCGPATKISEDELAERHAMKPARTVEHTVHSHLIPLDLSSTDFTEQERRSLYDFLVGVGAMPGDKVIVAARRERLSHRAPVVHFVRRLGLVPDLRLIKDLKLGNEDDGYDRTILIRFDRYVVRNLECGRWKDEYSTRFYNLRRHNNGCANVAALQQQVAYPSSLISGEALDFPEGDVAAESVSRYRGRRVEGIKAESAKSN